MAENEKPMPGEAEEGYEADIIVLEDEEGTEHSFEVIDAADHKGAHYMALVPYAEEDETAPEEDLDLILMKVNEDEKGEYLDLIEDDEELYEVGRMFEKRLAEFFEIEDLPKE